MQVEYTADVVSIDGASNLAGGWNFVFGNYIVHTNGSAQTVYYFDGTLRQVYTGSMPEAFTSVATWDIRYCYIVMWVQRSGTWDFSIYLFNNEKLTHAGSYATGQGSGTKLCFNYTYQSVAYCRAKHWNKTTATNGSTNSAVVAGWREDNRFAIVNANGVILYKVDISTDDIPEQVFVSTGTYTDVAFFNGVWFTRSDNTWSSFYPRTGDTFTAAVQNRRLRFNEYTLFQTSSGAALVSRFKRQAIDVSISASSCLVGNYLFGGSTVWRLTPASMPENTLVFNAGALHFNGHHFPLLNVYHGDVQNGVLKKAGVQYEGQVPVSGGEVSDVELRNALGVENTLMSRTYGTRWIGSIYYRLATLSSGNKQISVDFRIKRGTTVANYQVKMLTSQTQVNGDPLSYYFNTFATVLLLDHYIVLDIRGDPTWQSPSYYTLTYNDTDFTIGDNKTKINNNLANTQYCGIGDNVYLTLNGRLIKTDHTLKTGSPLASWSIAGADGVDQPIGVLRYGRGYMLLIRNGSGYDAYSLNGTTLTSLNRSFTAGESAFLDASGDYFIHITTTSCRVYKKSDFSGVGETQPVDWGNEMVSKKFWVSQTLVNGGMVSRNLKTYSIWLAGVLMEGGTMYNGKIVAMENVADGVFDYL